MRQGRFNKQAAEVAQRYSESVSFDWRLYPYDIAGSIAHATALAQAGILTADEREKIDNGLREIEAEIESGKFKWDQSLEDMHMNIEASLTKRIGVAGAKLHTARSRNDQVALDLRLYVKAEIAELDVGLRSLQTALLDLAEQHVDVVMPGYTHLQRAQPIFLAHYLLAQIEAFERDAERLRDCNARTDVLPLGSGALAGSTIVLDRELMAQQLGFTRVSQNSLDAVGDRDFVCEFLFCLAMIGMHLSRLSEDLITWSTHDHARQNRPTLRQLVVDLDHVESAAVILQSRHAGRQGGAFRFGRYRSGRAGGVFRNAAENRDQSQSHGSRGRRCQSSRNRSGGISR